MIISILIYRTLLHQRPHLTIQLVGQIKTWKNTWKKSTVPTGPTRFTIPYKTINHWQWYCKKHGPAFCWLAQCTIRAHWCIQRVMCWSMIQTPGVMGPTIWIAEQVQKAGINFFLVCTRLYGWKTSCTMLLVSNTFAAYHSLAASRSVTLHIATQTRWWALCSTMLLPDCCFKTGRLSKEHESGFWNSNLGVEKPATRKGREWIFPATNDTGTGHQCHSRAIFFRPTKAYTTGIEKHRWSTAKTGIYIIGHRMGFKTVHLSHSRGIANETRRTLGSLPHVSFSLIFHELRIWTI